MDIAALSDQLHRLVRLRFVNGEDVEAVLLGVDREAHCDVIYEVRRVLRTGSRPAAGTAVGCVLVADLNDLVEWEPVEPTGGDDVVV